MSDPLAPDAFEVVLLASTVATLVVWALLLRDLLRQGRPLSPTVALVVIAVIPLVGPMCAAAVLHSHSHWDAGPPPA